MFKLLSSAILIACINGDGFNSNDFEKHKMQLKGYFHFCPRDNNGKKWEILQHLANTKGYPWNATNDNWEPKELFHGAELFRQSQAEQIKTPIFQRNFLQKTDYYKEFDPLFFYVERSSKSIPNDENNLLILLAMEKAYNNGTEFEKNYINPTTNTLFSRSQENLGSSWPTWAYPKGYGVLQSKASMWRYSLPYNLVSQLPRHQHWESTYWLLNNYGSKQNWNKMSNMGRTCLNYIAEYALSPRYQQYQLNNLFKRIVKETDVIVVWASNVVADDYIINELVQYGNCELVQFLLQRYGEKWTFEQKYNHLIGRNGISKNNYNFVDKVLERYADKNFDPLTTPFGPGSNQYKMVEIALNDPVVGGYLRSDDGQKQVIQSSNGGDGFRIISGASIDLTDKGITYGQCIHNWLNTRPEYQSVQLHVHNDPVNNDADADAAE